MSVRKVRNTWWVDFRFGRVRYRKRCPENSKSGAQAYESLLRQKLARGEPLSDQANLTKPHSETLKSFAGEWFKMHVGTNCKRSTERSCRMILDQHLLPAFGGLGLDEIDAVGIEAYKSGKMRAGLSPKTINNQLSVLASCLSKAVEWGRLQVKPKITWLKVPPQGFDFLEPLDSSRLLEAIAVPQWRAMVLCALRTGMRMGELLGLHWQDVDLERREITVRRSIVRGVEASPKNNRMRHLPLSEDLHSALADLKPRSGYVFKQGNGEPITRGMAWRALQTACKGSGVREIGWHVLRHTFASQLTAKGVSMRAVQELLGHSDLKMTMRYSHLAPSTLREAVALLQQGEESEKQKFGQQAVNTRKKLSESDMKKEAVLQTLLR